MREPGGAVRLQARRDLAEHCQHADLQSTIKVSQLLHGHICKRRFYMRAGDLSCACRIMSTGASLDL